MKQEDKTPITMFKVSVLLLFLVIFIGLAIIAEEANGQDTLNVQPYHIVNPDSHRDTLFFRGYSVQHLVDSTGTAVFLYDPNTGKWDIDSTLSTGLLE